jgi:protein-histidine N-methyltransferase
MSGQFAFSFAGDDIEDEGQTHIKANHKSAEPSAASGAFPVAGKPLLPATRHDLKDMLSQLPSKIAFSTLDIDLESKGTIQLPRRELWDVRVQLMAEDDGADPQPGLGGHDVKTGVYEGGFKSWESSVDLVKVLSQSSDIATPQDCGSCVIEVSSY